MITLRTHFHPANTEFDESAEGLSARNFIGGTADGDLDEQTVVVGLINEGQMVPSV